MPLLEILPQGSFQQRVLVGLREAPQSRTANALSNWISLDAVAELGNRGCPVYLRVLRIQPQTDAIVMAVFLTPACASGMICGGSVGAGRKRRSAIRTRPPWLIT